MSRLKDQNIFLSKIFIGKIFFDCLFPINISHFVCCTANTSFEKNHPNDAGSAANFRPCFALQADAVKK